MPEAKLKKIPGFSQGVRDNSAMRMVKLAAPICPNSQRKRQADGTFAEVGQNCQLGGGEWWVMCKELGHNPYFRTKVWYEQVDDWDPETNELKGTKKIRHSDTTPNIVQVPLARRMHNGNGVALSMQKKGRIRLTDLGYEEVCQFRNCQKPISPKARSRAFGNYCSTEHMALIAADSQGIFLTQLTGVLEGDQIEQSRQKRRKGLMEAVAFKDSELT